jgi:hypothetical protein
MMFCALCSVRYFIRLSGLVIKVLILEAQMKYLLPFLTVAFMLLLGCSKDNPTQPPAGQASLLLSKLVVSVIPGARDTITISSSDPNGAYSECTISNSNSSVASCTIADSTLQITGISVGTTDLTITNDDGNSCILPVEIYDKNVVVTDELIVTYTDQFTPLGGGWWDWDKWEPVTPEGFYALGSFMWLRADSDPNGVAAVMVVKAKPGSDAIAFTDSFQSLGGNLANFWLPIPPSGYKAMGMVAGPPPESLACIREDLTIAGETDSAAYVHSNSVYSIWLIEQPIAGAHEKTFMAQGTFIFVPGTDAPIDHPAANILKVDLPMLPEADFQNFAPRLTSLNQPMDQTQPMMGKGMLVPFSVIKDLVNNTGWQVTNSPTYRLEREVYYKKIYWNYNQTSQLQTNSVELVSGISTTQSEQISGEIGLSLSWEAGCNIELYSAKVTTTVSVKFGYERMTSITELQEKHVTTSINTPPGKAAALWQRFNRFTLYRHNGTALEPVGSYEVGIDSYVTDEYPDE